MSKSESIIFFEIFNRKTFNACVYLLTFDSCRSVCLNYESNLGATFKTLVLDSTLSDL